MKITFFETKDWEEDSLKENLSDHSLKFYKEPLSVENVDQVNETEIISVFIYSKIGREILDKLPQLKLITTRSTGFDHIDLEEAQRREVTVCNVPTYGENTVAEHTFGLILSLSRNIHQAYVRTLREDYRIEGLKGFELKGKTLGVVGAGHIGLHVIRIAKSFGMEVIAFDVNEDDFLAEVLGFSYVSLEELLGSSDIITLHVPDNKHTHHLINRESIKLIKEGAVLINTSRGGIVDTEALIEALDKGILAGAGLDVIEGEELIKEEKQLLYEMDKMDVLGDLVKGHILLSKENVVFTPHIGFYSQEALERILSTTVKNIECFLQDSAQNIVTG